MLFKKKENKKESTQQVQKYLSVSCVLNSDISTPDLVIIKKDGVVLGNIQAHSVDIAGDVNGNIVAKDLVILRNGSKVKGNIKTTNLEVKEGAKCDVNIQTSQSEESMGSNHIETKKIDNPENSPSQNQDERNKN